MAELTKQDLQYAIQDALRDIKNDIRNIKENTVKVEQRTNDLDQSQVEIRRLVELAPKFEGLGRELKEISMDVNNLDGLMGEVQTLKSQLQMTTEYLRQVAGYLQAMDARHRGQAENDASSTTHLG